MSDTPEADVQAANIEAERKKAADAAVKADRERRAAVMALPEATGREALAEHLYSATEMGIEEIKATLAVAPEPAKEQPAPQPAADAYEASRMAGAGLGGATHKTDASDRLVKKMAAMIEKGSK